MSQSVAIAGAVVLSLAGLFGLAKGVEYSGWALFVGLACFWGLT